MPLLHIFTIWKTYYQQTKQHVHIISRIISSRLLSVRRVLQKHKAGTKRRHEMLEFPCLPLRKNTIRTE
uniref:Uncharacterized protein n=2 Tax=Oryza TaxID=4527 RepID=A0A0D3F8R2_9ORYZ